MPLADRTQRHKSTTHAPAPALKKVPAKVPESSGDAWPLYLTLAVAAVIGYILGRIRSVRVARETSARFIAAPKFQNDGEEYVSRILNSRFVPPHYHLLNHVTLRMEDGTTQIDHILVSRFGVFVIETKDYSGWIFANATGSTWTHVFHTQKFLFQNPIHQNFRHVRAVQAVLDFLPAEHIRSLVVFCGSGEFRTDKPAGVVDVDELANWICQHATPVISQNRMQFCVGRLETARLAISGETDVEHVRNVTQRLRGGTRNWRGRTPTGQSAITP